MIANFRFAALATSAAFVFCAFASVPAPADDLALRHVPRDCPAAVVFDFEAAWSDPELRPVLENTLPFPEEEALSVAAGLRPLELISLPLLFAGSQRVDSLLAIRARSPLLAHEEALSAGMEKISDEEGEPFYLGASGAMALSDEGRSLLLGSAREQVAAMREAWESGASWTGAELGVADGALLAGTFRLEETPGLWLQSVAVAMMGLDSIRGVEATAKPAQAVLMGLVSLGDPPRAVSFSARFEQGEFYLEAPVSMTSEAGAERMKTLLLAALDLSQVLLSGTVSKKAEPEARDAFKLSLAVNGNRADIALELAVEKADCVLRLRSPREGFLRALRSYAMPKTAASGREAG